MAGFAKCIMMILASSTPPNQHLKVLNPHLIVEGYPVCFTTELTPWGQNSGYCGVSSFGIGGTNARGEIRKSTRDQVANDTMLEMSDRARLTESPIASVKSSAIRWSGFAGAPESSFIE